VIAGLIRKLVTLHRVQYNVPCRFAIEDPDEAARKTTPEQPQLLLQLNRYSWMPGRCLYNKGEGEQECVGGILVWEGELFGL
jgi:hypothetical protein